MRIIQDWIQPGGGGGGGRMIAAQLRRDAERARRNAEHAYRKALARALRQQQTSPRASDPAVHARRVEWNKLLSKLNDELLQGKGELPPPEYRRAIEQYLTRISQMERSTSPDADGAGPESVAPESTP